MDEEEARCDISSIIAVLPNLLGVRGYKAVVYS